MCEYVARLIDCGIPRVTAICICRYFKNKHQMRELDDYVASVEAECGGDYV